MDTQQVNCLLTDIPEFVGTFACNLIPNPQTLPAAYVVNTGRVRLRKTTKNRDQIIVDGEHWVTIILKDTGKADFFDSYGLPPTEPEMIDFIQRNSESGVRYSTQMLQNPASRLCGAYCVDYIRQRLVKMCLRKSIYLTSQATL